jgi:hypothetical protein
VEEGRRPGGARSRPALRLAAAIVASEVVPVLVLVVIVFVYGLASGGPRSANDAFAQRAGLWVGPIAGALATGAFAHWAARVAARPLMSGTIVGVGSAALDLAILLAILAASGAPFRPLFAVFALGRAVAGVIGGAADARGRARPAPAR